MLGSNLLEAMVSLDFGKGEEEIAIATKWLSSRNNKITSFINGEYSPETGDVFPIINPSTREELAKLHKGDASSVESAVSSAKEAFAIWNERSGFERAKVLLQAAKTIEENKKLLSVVEAADIGRHVKGIETHDIPVAIQTAYYYASKAQLSDIDFKDFEAVGIVGVLVSSHTLLSSICQTVFAALAGGNAVILKPSISATLTSVLLAELVHEAGVPAGTFNVVVGDDVVEEGLIQHSGINALHVIGTVDQGKFAVHATAGTGKRLGLELTGKNPLIVFDSADLDSSCEAIWEGALQGSAFGCRVLVQESVYEKFAEKLKAKLLKIKVGNALDRNVDFGSLCCEVNLKNVQSCIDLARLEGAEIVQTDAPEGNFLPPTLIFNSQTASKIVQDPIDFPALCILPFRTAKEAIAIANNSLYGLGAGVFTENSALALEVAKSLKVGTVWINSFGSVDPATGQTGFKRSGNINKEGLLEFLKPCGKKLVQVMDCDVTAVGRESTDSSIVKTIQAASAAQQKWGKLPCDVRAEKILAVANKIDAQKSQISSELQKLTGVTSDDAAKEVKVAVECLYYFAAVADKQGKVKDTVRNELVVRLEEPLGVIGIITPDTTPLAAFCMLVGCAIVRGNFALVAANKHVPKTAVEAMATLPSFKVINGNADSVARQLAEEEDLHGLWYFGSYAGSKMVEAQSACNFKRTWVNYGEDFDWLSYNQAGDSCLQRNCVQYKHVWFPVGDIFAN